MVSVAAQTLLTNPFFYIGLGTCIVVWHLWQRKQPGPQLVFKKIGIPPKNSSLKQEWTTVDALDKIFQQLIRQQYTFLTPKKLNSLYPEKSVLLVFAGGYRSFYTYVFPLLEKYQVPAVVLIAPDLIGTYNSWQDPYKEPWQDLLTLEEDNELKKSPLIYWGALPLSCQNSTACSKEQAVFAIKESIFRLEHQLGISPSVWSNYPASKTSPDVLSSLTQQGIKLPLMSL